MRIPNDKQNELYYCGIKQLILKKLTENNFINLSHLWIEEILNPDHFEAILNNAHSYFLVKALIDLKRGNSLTSENTSFICSYKTLLSCPLASILVYMEQMDLNTFKNRERLRHSHDRLIPLLYAIELLVKAESLTQENFELIQAKEKITWLYALWNMPIDLINADVWQGLINLSVTSKENEFNKDINTYAKSLRSKKIKRNETVEKGSKLKINKLDSDFFSYSEESVMLTDPVETRVSLLRS